MIQIDEMHESVPIDSKCNHPKAKPAQSKILLIPNMYDGTDE
jgi:hypothetical protein